MTELLKEAESLGLLKLAYDEGRGNDEVRIA